MARIPPEREAGEGRMIDEIPFIPGIIATVILWLSVGVVEFRHAPLDPNATYSRLDRLDGLDSRTG